MKKQKIEFKKELFESLKLTNDEMLNVKGGTIKPGDICIPSPPPIRI